MDQVPGVLWLLCAMVSKGLEALGGCARRGKRTRSAGNHLLKMVRKEKNIIFGSKSEDVFILGSDIPELDCGRLRRGNLIR